MPVPVKAFAFGALVLLVTLVVGIGTLRFIVGPERYAGPWGLAEQLAYVQLVGALLTVALAGGFGWYAFEQLAEALRVRKDQRLNEASRLRDALAVLKKSLKHNQERFDSLRAVVEKGGGAFEPGLDVAAWDAVRPDVMPFLHVPALAAALAQHFNGVAALGRALERYSVSKVRVAEFSTSEAAEMQKTYLLRRIQSLQDDAQQLVSNIDDCLAESSSVD